MTEFYNTPKKSHPPEGSLLKSDSNKRYTETRRALEECITSNRTIEAICVICDSHHNLIVDFGFIKGVIPRNEGAIGIQEGSTRDIALISRVNKPVCAKVCGFVGENELYAHMTDDFIRKSYPGYALMSRKKAQLECISEYINHLSPGDIISAKITHLEQFGCFIDIGRGLPSLIPIDSISISRISHPSDRFCVGMDIIAVVKSIDKNSGIYGVYPKITLTHKELLGTWEQNAANFTPGETVSGIVRSVESYGIFVELLPNLAGLAELRDNIVVNQSVSVYIKAIIGEKMKIKLIIVDSFDSPKINYDYNYYITSGNIDSWVYSTETADKQIRTDFHSWD